MPASIVTRRLAIHSRGRVVIREFNWSHTPPGVVWVLGSNGSGKSSLLQVFAGWRRASAGVVEWAQSTRAGVKYYAPAMSAPPALRVGDFVALTSRQARLSENNLVDELYPRAVPDDAPFGRVSTGEARRLLLWGLLRQGRAALILDEPYEHLSRDAQSVLTLILRERARDHVVVVATNQYVAAASEDCLLNVDGEQVEVAHAS